MFEKIGNKLFGYKVMPLGRKGIISGSDSRQDFNLKVNAIIKMPYNGVYLSNDPDYVIDYYSGLSDDEVILKLMFSESDVIDGLSQMNDAQPEIGVSKVQIVCYQKVDDYDRETIINNHGKHKIENESDCSI
jgi:hypothetical protein